MNDSLADSSEKELTGTLNIRDADYYSKKDKEDILYLLNVYAKDPMGLDKELPDKVRSRLFKEWKKIQTAFSILAYLDDRAVGLLNAFFGFSTFKAAPLINIHDIVVLEEVRGLNIGRKLLEAVEAKARENGCCKITLEVRDDNPARRLYKRFGFSDEEPPMRFWTKEL